MQTGFLGRKPIDQPVHLAVRQLTVNRAHQANTRLPRGQRAAIPCFTGGLPQALRARMVAL